MCGIYKITNTTNNKAYVGQSICIKTRWKQHRCDAFNPNDPGYEYPLYRAFRKHGLRYFKFEVLEECSVSKLDEREIYYITLYDTYYNGYNQDKGGHGASHFTKLSEDLVDKIIERLKTSYDNSDIIGSEFGVSGRTIRGINSGDACRKDSETYPIRRALFISDLQENFCIVCGAKINQGAKYCVKCAQIAQRRAERPEPLALAEMIKENGFSNVGKHFGVDGNAIKKWCKQYGIPHKLNDLINWYNKQIGIDEYVAPSKERLSKTPVEQIDPQTGEVIATFESATAAARTFGKKKGAKISDVCNGHAQSAYGYLWRFASPSTTSNSNPTA